ncbi:MAG TPA: tetratricopeptide repeat protein [Povalibacter sp.]|nr:tetratricopeptide repeat protein [Povalibacter sp.]
MPFFVASILLQAALIVHVLRTGRNTLWIWILALLPMAGPVAYLLVEILPGILGGRTARRAVATVRKTIDPTRDLRHAHKLARLTNSIDARRRLAEELAEAGQHDDAIASYRAALTGIYEHDPHLLLGLARTLFAKGDAPGARQALDELIRANPDFRSIEGHILYARALEGEGSLAKAADEYQALVGYDAGAEARYRQAALLKRMGEKIRAKELFRKLLDDAELTTRHARKLQKEWLDLAKRELAND